MQLLEFRPPAQHSEASRRVFWGFLTSKSPSIGGFRGLPGPMKLLEFFNKKGVSHVCPLFLHASA
jgi:hypothetical protein